MTQNAYSTLIFSILLGVIGQLLLKYGMSTRSNFRISEVLSLIDNFPVIGGFLSYAVSVLFYFQALKNLDLSIAYPTVSLGYVLVVLFSKFLFKEKVTLGRWLAVVIICTGVILVGLGE